MSTFAMRYRDVLTSAALAALAAAAAPAQAQDAEEVERCRAAPTMEERVACLENVVNALSGVPAEPAPEPGATVAPPAEPEPSAAALGTLTTPAAAPDSVSAPAEPAPPAGPAPSATAAAAPPAAAPAPPAASAALPQGIGAQQVIARRPGGARELEEREPPEQALIVAHAVHGYAQLEVTLDNGQVWRQLQGDSERVRLRGDEPIPVTISPSRFGGYRMAIETPRREIQVERIR
jgi:hypothetical protein